MSMSDNRPEIYPVVHIIDEAQAAEQSAMAFEAGADGVYLIDYKSPSTLGLVSVYNRVVAENPDRFIGVNFHQLPTPSAAFKFLNNLLQSSRVDRLPNGLWVDDAWPFRDACKAYRKEHSDLKVVTYLGGAAFKYTRRHTEDPQKAAVQAVETSAYVDIVVTSEPGTVEEPNPDKVKAMKRAIDPKRLAVVGGISAQNWHLFAPWTDQLLATTSIETRPQNGIFDEEKLRELIEAVHTQNLTS